MQLPRTLTIKGDSFGSENFSPTSFLLLLSLPEYHTPSYHEVQSWLSADEINVYENCGARLRLDYLLGRRAAKLALMNFFGLNDPQLLSIMNDVHGRPVVYGAPFTGEAAVSLSISHGGGAAAALVHSDELAMGIDIEPIVRKPSRIDGLRHMMGDDEQIAMMHANGAVADNRVENRAGNRSDYPVDRRADNTETESLYRLWCLKEALGKALGTGLAAPYNRLEIGQSNHPSPRYAPSLIRSQYLQEPEFSGWSLVAGRYCFAVAAAANPSWTVEVYTSDNPHARKYSL